MPTSGRTGYAVNSTRTRSTGDCARTGRWVRRPACCSTSSTRRRSSTSWRASTGITGLIPDPHYFGGGLHTIERGGYLRVHADFNPLSAARRPAQDQRPPLPQPGLGGRLGRSPGAVGPVAVTEGGDDRPPLQPPGRLRHHTGHRLPRPSEPAPRRPRVSPVGPSLSTTTPSTARPAELTDPHSTLWQPGVGEKLIHVPPRRSWRPAPIAPD